MKKKTHASGTLKSSGDLDHNLQRLALVGQRFQWIFQHCRQKDIYAGVDLGRNDAEMIKVDLVNLSTNCYMMLSAKAGFAALTQIKPLCCPSSTAFSPDAICYLW